MIHVQLGPGSSRIVERMCPRSGEVKWCIGGNSIARDRHRWLGGSRVLQPPSKVMKLKDIKRMRCGDRSNDPPHIPGHLPHRRQVHYQTRCDNGQRPGVARALGNRQHHGSFTLSTKNYRGSYLVRHCCVLPRTCLDKGRFRRQFGRGRPRLGFFGPVLRL